MAYFNLIRWPNLFIVFLTQAIIYFKVVIPTFDQVNLDTTLDLSHFLLLTFITMLIAAGGYVINDILDQPIDVINKPQKQYVGRVFSVQHAWWTYGWINVLGLVAAIYLALQLDYLAWIWIYPFAVALLAHYSLHAKCIPLWGNLIVSLFCAGVVGIIWFVEAPVLWDQPEDTIYEAWFVVLFYLFFSFFTTFFREVIKDLQDVSGDKNQNCLTFPVKAGTGWGKLVTGMLGLILTAGIFMAAQNCFSWDWIPAFVFLLIGIGLPMIYLLYLVYMAKNAADFGRISQGMKWIMVAGLAWLFFTPI